MCVVGAVLVVASIIAVNVWHRRESDGGKEPVGEARTSPAASAVAGVGCPPPASGGGRLPLLSAPAREDYDEAVRIAKAEGKGVAAVLAAVRDSAGGWRNLRACLSVCALEDPEGTANWAAANLGRGGDLAFALRRAMSNWVDLDPNGAVVWAENHSDAAVRECALSSVFQAWAQWDPAAAALRLAEVADFRTRSLSAGTIAYYRGLEDLPAATEWALGLPEGPSRVCALANIVRHLYAREESRSMDWGRELREAYEQDSTVRQLEALLERQTPGSAAGFSVDMIPGGPGPDAALQIRIADWTGRDSWSAIDWAMRFADDHSREYALGIVAERLARDDPALAAEVIGEMPDGVRRSRAVRRIAFYWTQQDPIAADFWAERLDDPADAESAQAGIEEAVDAESGTGESGGPDDAGGESDDDIPGDVYLLPWWETAPIVEQLPDGELRNSLLYRTATQWAAEDPVAALEWTGGQLPPGPALDWTVRTIMCEWTKRDPVAATAWALGRQETHRREHAVFSVIMEQAKTDPASASGLIPELASRADQSNAICIVAFRWGAVDKTAAMTWADNLPSEGDRLLALDKISRAGR
jgi:hypothetical protein